MMQKTEQLLEQLLNNADEQREYLKNVLEALNGNPPNGGGGGGPNGGNNNREEKKTFNEFLKQYSASAKQIAEGALNKFYKEFTLLQQEFVKNPKLTIAQYLAAHDKELTVVGFQRYTLNAE